MKSAARNEPASIAAALSNPDPSVRVAILFRVRRSKKGLEIPAAALGPLLKDKVTEVRRAAANALARMKEDALNAMPQLIEAIADEDEPTRQSAGRAIRRLGAQVTKAIPPLLGALESANPVMRRAAAKTLGRIARQAETVVPKLLNTLVSDPDLGARRAAIIALGAFPSCANKSVPFLIEALDRGALRIAAIDALGSLGSHGKSAIPRLLELLTSPKCGGVASYRGAYALRLIARGDERLQRIAAEISQGETKLWIKYLWPRDDL